MARYLVTAGPTREAIDPVRFLSNRSSGRMGYALADALMRRGHDVILISGPVALKPPPVRVVEQVESAREMLAACESNWGACDGVFAVAAVSDFRPAEVSAQKWKRGEDQAPSIALTANPDIIATLCMNKGKRLAVAFAVETEHEEANALAKMRRKGVDYIALNSPAAQGAKSSSLLLLGAEGLRQPLGPAPKEELVESLLDAIFDNRDHM
jgi:phosphopantothenoylcysteine decarboxylase/phosphopantothenate--cysteine ligase